MREVGSKRGSSSLDIQWFVGCGLWKNLPEQEKEAVEQDGFRVSILMKLADCLKAHDTSNFLVCIILLRVGPVGCELDRSRCWLDRSEHGDMEVVDTSQ
jgi:hypothetical protein